MTNYAFITGATAGFGKACADIFAKNGWNLIITGRRQDRLETIKDQIKADYNIEVISLCFDVREEQEVIRAVESLSVDITSNLTLLVNNAGLAVGKGTIDSGLSDDWNRMIDTNVKGLLYVTKAVVPFLKANDNSQIINIASIAGKEVDRKSVV